MRSSAVIQYAAGLTTLGKIAIQHFVFSFFSIQIYLFIYLTFDIQSEKFEPTVMKCRQTEFPDSTLRGMTFQDPVTQNATNCNITLTELGIIPTYYRIQHLKEGNNHCAAARHLTLYVFFVCWEIPVEFFSFTHRYAVDKAVTVTNAVATHFFLLGENKKLLFEEHIILE